MIPLPKPTFQMVPDNALVVLDGFFQKRKGQVAPKMADSAFWEFFAAEQILKDYSLDLEDIKFGLVGQEWNKDLPGSDGGIDSIYLIANGKLLRDTDQAKELGKHKGPIRFEVIIIQSKRRVGFEMDPLIRFNNTSETIFNIAKPPEQFSEKYNSLLLNIVSCFREACSSLIQVEEFKFAFHFFVVTRGNPGDADANIIGKKNELTEKVRKLVPMVDACSATLVGAQTLIEIYRRPKKNSLSIKCRHIIDDTKGGYVALVGLDDFYSFISQDGQIRESLFESNVRDYEGEQGVNRQIKQTLSNPEGGVDFWWLNNGVTVIANSVSQRPPFLKLSEPQIVNGLQTSQVIFRHFIQPEFPVVCARPDWSIVVRIISSDDSAVWDKIIRATNSQTKIPPEYLWASESRQRDIEDIFRNHGLHYERRKGSWRDSGRCLDCVVGPLELAQNVAAMLLLEPDHARARPSRYSKPDMRQKIFHPNIPLRLYVVVSLIRQRTEEFLKKKETNQYHRNNLLFYLMTALTAFLPSTKGKRFKDIDVSELPEEAFLKAYELVRPMYESAGEEDVAAKGTDLARMVKDRMAGIRKRNTKKQKLQTT